MITNAAALHIPEPATRPGQSSDFAQLQIAAAPSLPRPALDATSRELSEYCYGLIRVLDEQHRASGDWCPDLGADDLLAGLRAMMLTRAYDNRMVRVQRQGKTSFYMKSTGEEAVAVAAANALNGDDMCFPTYRQQGLLIARNWPIVDMMNQVYSNTSAH